MFSFSPNVNITTDRPIWGNSKSCVLIITLKAGKTLPKAKVVFGEVLCFKVLPFVVEETKRWRTTSTRPFYAPAAFQVRMRQSEHTDTLVDILVKAVSIHYDRQWANHTTAISTSTVGQASLSSVINGYERELRVICFASFNPLLESAKQIMKSERTSRRCHLLRWCFCWALQTSLASSFLLIRMHGAQASGKANQATAAATTAAACRQGLPHWQCACARS